MFSVRTKLPYYIFFRGNFSAIEMEKTPIYMNKPAYLVLPILELNKISMSEFWYDYVKPTYREKAKVCYMDPKVLLFT